MIIINTKNLFYNSSLIIIIYFIISDYLGHGQVLVNQIHKSWVADKSHICTGIENLGKLLISTSDCESQNCNANFELELASNCEGHEFIWLLIMQILDFYWQSNMQNKRYVLLINFFIRWILIGLLQITYWFVLLQVIIIWKCHEIKQFISESTFN